MKEVLQKSDGEKLENILGAVQEKESWIWSKRWVQIPALFLITWVTLNKLTPFLWVSVYFSVKMKIWSGMISGISFSFTVPIHGFYHSVFGDLYDAVAPPSISAILYQKGC